ncbi:hypothetical protein EIP86_006404 [Pleurotus ostreatoroseus]|nr:hypothetical protein EIP86_006404 [Pleurotus ostreatoroseus]
MAATLGDVADKTFDYVIIGGGAAGLTVAARLSKDKDTSYALEHTVFILATRCMIGVTRR